MLVGLLVANVLGKLAQTIVRKFRVDQAFDHLGWTKHLSSIGIDMHPSVVARWLVKWGVIIAVFSAIVDYLGAPQLSPFLNDIIAFIPNVLVAVAIVIVGSVLANFSKKAVAGAIENAHGVTHKSLIAALPKYAILTLAVLAALNQLQIGGNLIEILFTGIVVALSLAFGLAFGLGGKEHAQRFLDRIDHE